MSTQYNAASRADHKGDSPVVLRASTTRSTVDSIALAVLLPGRTVERECAASGVFGCGSQFLLDQQQPVVFRDAIGSAQRPGLDLRRRRANREIGDRRIL